MGLSVVIDKDKCTAEKKRFAEFLHTRICPMLDEDKNISQNTPGKPWDENFTILATEWVFSVHGNLGAKQFGNFIATTHGSTFLEDF